MLDAWFRGMKLSWVDCSHPLRQGNWPGFVRVIAPVTQVNDRCIYIDTVPAS